MKTLLRLLAWIGKKAQDKLLMIEKRDREAKAEKTFPAGTLVQIVGCPCPGDHSGVWKIDRYDWEADDFHLTRTCDGKTTYATAKVMRKV